MKILRILAAALALAAAPALAGSVSGKDYEIVTLAPGVQLARDFQGYVVQPALERAIRQDRKEPAAFTQKLR